MSANNLVKVMRKKDPFLRRLHPKLTDEQCCMMIAMRDVLGIKAAEHHFNIPAKKQIPIGEKVKTSPHLDTVYWQYRNSIAKRWMNQLGETMSATLLKITETIGEDEINLLQLRELVRAAEVLGDISVSATAIAPEGIELDAVKHQIIDVTEESEQYLLPASKVQNNAIG